MERANFQKLRIYALSEGLSDCVWDAVSRWDGFAKDRVGRQLADY